MEKWQGRIMDANYTKVDMDDVVNDLGIKKDKQKGPEEHVKKFPNIC